MGPLFKAARAKIEELSALMMDSLSADISHPKSYVDMQELSTKFATQCSMLDTMSLGSIRSKSQLMPYDRNKTTENTRLSSELMQDVLSYLTNRDLRCMEQVSRSWYLAVQSLKKHHNLMVQNEYALEHSYFGSSKVNGWLGPCYERALRVIKYAPRKALFPREVSQYLHFLAEYRAEYQTLCSLVLAFARAARPTLHFDRDALYRLLLQWNTWQWRGHLEYPIPLVADHEDDGAPRTVIVDFLPDSLLIYLTRERRFFDSSNDHKRGILGEPACQW